MSGIKCENEKCDAIYSLRDFKISSKERETHHCEKCGHVLIDKRVRAVLTYTLLNPDTKVNKK